MKKWMIAVGAVLFLTACGTVEEPPTDDPALEEPATDDSAIDYEGATGYNAQAARETYESSCIGCHGGNLEGISGPTLIETGLTQDEIKAIIQGGKGAMPAFSNIPEDEITNLAQWISEQ